MKRDKWQACSDCSKSGRTGPENVPDRPFRIGKSPPKQLESFQRERGTSRGLSIGGTGPLGTKPIPKVRKDFKIWLILSGFGKYSPIMKGSGRGENADRTCANSRIAYRYIRAGMRVMMWKSHLLSFDAGESSHVGPIIGLPDTLKWPSKDTVRETNGRSYCTLFMNNFS